MSAFGGKADISGHAAMSASDPKRTSPDRLLARRFNLLSFGGNVCANRKCKDTFLTALSLSVFSGQAAAQQAKTYRIGFLTPAPAASMEARVGRFKQGLRQLGHIEG